MNRFIRNTLLIPLFISCSITGLAQSFRIEAKEPPSVVTSGSQTFTSLEGRFTISLPSAVSSYAPLSINTPTGKVTRKEELVYSSNGSLSQKYVYILDDKGNALEEDSFNVKDGSVRNKYSYKYEFDLKGN